MSFVKGRPARCSICDREECENTYRILLNDDGLPQLTLNRGYRAMKWDKSQREVSHYIRERYSSALQFLKTWSSANSPFCVSATPLSPARAGFWTPAWITCGRS